MTQSKSMHSTATVLFFTAMTLAISTPVLAVVDVGWQVVLDFTQPDKIKQMAHWTDEHYINSTRDGLGWDGKAREHRDVVIETVEPIAVGWSWHPVTTLNIATEVIPAGKFTFNGGVAFPSTASTLYARYSPDGKHWSTWQALKAQVPRDKEHPRLWIQGTLRVPRKARQRYAKLLREFARTDRPISVDEEAAVRWILEKQPDFFKHELPFIGYVEFLYETSIQGNQRLKRLNINLSYHGSRMSLPPGHRVNSRWRFKVPGPPSSAVVDVNDRTGPMLDKLANYAWGEKLDGLRIGISPVKPYQQNDNDKTRFNVALQNVGKKDLVLNLGMMLANGKYQYARAVKLIFTDHNGKSYEFHNNLDRRPGIAGRVDPFLVPLAGGCTYVLRVDFDNYWLVPVGTSLPKGQYHVAAVFEGKALDFKDTNLYTRDTYWAGVIKSKEVLFKNTHSGSALQKPNFIVFQKGKR